MIAKMLIDKHLASSRPISSSIHGVYLQARIETLDTRNHGNRELIIIDDCSTDSSVQIVRTNNS